MARADRRLAAGSMHHVHNRGALRRTLFENEADWRLFLGALHGAPDRHEVELFAWCLMPNHWHLLARPCSSAALPAFMRWLTLAHSRRWQVLHGQTGMGTLYQGRYRSHPVAQDEHLLTVVHYIERNPVRAKLLTCARDSPWSSVGERLGGSGGLLAPLPLSPPDDWMKWLNRPETQAKAALSLGRLASRGA